MTIWHISDGGPVYTWRDLLTALEPRLRSPPPHHAPARPAWVGIALPPKAGRCSPRSDPVLDRSRVTEMRQRAWLTDGAQLQADTGWRPRTQLDDGMAETMNWYRQADWL